jgi:hypothetical protein
MKTQNCFIMRFMAAFLFANVAIAAGGVVRIPLNTFTKPPSDLRLNGKNLSFADMAQMHQQDPEGLSKVNPVENKYWQNKKYPAVDAVLHAKMPKSDTGVSFDNYIGANRELGIYSVVIRTEANEKYVLTLGQQVNSSLLKSALLRKMGYYQESPKYYPKIKVTFPSKEAKETFINTAFCENGPSEAAVDCLSISPFMTDTNKKEYLSHSGDLSLYVHGCYLEKMNAEVPSLFDGLTPASTGSLPYFSTSRAFRGLLVPFVVGDLGESLNRVSTQAVEIRDGWANINYGFDYYFDETGASDVQWATRILAGLNDADWDEIIQASQYPESTRQLVKAVVMSRAKNFVDGFIKKSERGIFTAQIPSLKYDSKNGYVKKGKVVVESIPGYPQRFSNGDRQSPFESGDFARYMKVKGISSAISIAIDKLEDVVHANFPISLGQNVRGVEVGPQGVRPIGNFSAMNLGLGLNASRTITTGTFYGSTAPIQLVDNIAVTASVGLMHMINEIGGYGISLGGNVAYTRDFTHVRPLNSIKESGQVSLMDINVKSKLKKLGKLLEDGKFKDQAGDKPGTDGFVDFMAELRSGEVLLITDSIGAAAQAGASVGLDSLIGFYAGPISPSIGLTAGGAKVLLRQIQITKTDDGLQVFVRNQNTRAFSLAFDVNYFINLLKIKAETVNTDLHTDAFILNYNSEFVAKGDMSGQEGGIDLNADEELKAKYEQQKKFGRQAAGALRGLIRQSSTDKLFAYFPFQRFSIDHKLNTKTIKTKILWYRATKLNEEHLLTIQKPVINTPEGSTVVNQPIEIVSYRKGELKGRDLLGFGLEGADGVSSRYLKEFAPTLNQATQNPTQMPFGQAQWRIVKTETEITKGREGALPMVSTIQHMWGGWSIKAKKLTAILESIKEHIKGTEYDGSELIPDNTFRNLDKIDFYRVTTNLSLMPSGIDKMKSLIVEPETEGLTLDKPTFFGRLLRKIVSIKDKRRLEDKAVYNAIISMIGDGDYNKGRAIYIATCAANTADGYVYTERLKGTEYECLEPWLKKIIKLSREYGKGSLREQNKWMTEMLFVLEEKIAFSSLLKFLGKENYVFYIEIAGFRSGDENADIGTYMSNILGEPEKKRPYSNGLMTVISEKSKIISTELDRTQADFQ